MAISKEELQIIERKAEHIYREDSILSLANDKYAERHLFYYDVTGLYYVQYTVFDNIIEYCHYNDGDVFDKKWKALEYYNSILDLVGGEVFIYGQE
jgi:hypothetical protein